MINQAHPQGKGESVPRIRILDPQVAAKIAAGEVIIRPAAAVKELVENALDAGALTITVGVEEGGRKLIRVVDDGCGMTPDEMPLSLQRHATSKLAAESDLLGITTLGFRGEALPSIAAVSHLTLISCPPGAPAGLPADASGRGGSGRHGLGGAGRHPGGGRRLFFNTPARRKFLKSQDSEQAQILEVLRGLALGYPQVHFTLCTPTRTLLAAPAAAALVERLAAVLNPELAAHMLPLSLAQGAWQVTGLTTEPDFNLASSRFQVFLVNGRVVADRILGAVLEGGLCRAPAPGPAPRGAGGPEAPPRGRGRQRPSRQDRNPLSGAGQGLSAAPDGPAPGPGAASRGEPPVPGDLAAGGRPPGGGKPGPGDSLSTGRPSPAACPGRRRSPRRDRGPAAGPRRRQPAPGAFAFRTWPS